MSPYSKAILLALYTCLGWGMIAPMAVKMSQALGAKFNPLFPFFWNALGNIFFSIVILVLFGPSQLKSWSWHWSGWVIFVAWSTASIAIVVAFNLVQGKTSVVNAVAATYPVLVSAVLLWYFFGEPMSIQKVGFLVLTVVGVVGLILSP